MIHTWGGAVVSRPLRDRRDRVGETPPSRDRRYRSWFGLNSTGVRGSSGATFVTMMQPAHLWDHDDWPDVWRLDGAGLWRILLQAEVRAAPMIVVHESSEMAIQTGFTEYDHVIQALPSNRANHPLNVSPLPRRPRRRQHLLDAHRLHLHDKIRPKNPIAIAQQVARRCLPWEGLAQLLSGPCRGRTAVNPKMQDAPSVMRQHQEHVQHLEPDGRHRKEIDGNMDFT